MLQESESEDSEEERQTEAEKRKQRALMRIAKRKEASETKLSLDNLRAPVVCVWYSTPPQLHIANFLVNTAKWNKWWTRFCTLIEGLLQQNALNWGSTISLDISGVCIGTCWSWKDQDFRQIATNQCARRRGGRHYSTDWSNQCACPWHPEADTHGQRCEEFITCLLSHSSSTLVCT